MKQRSFRWLVALIVGALVVLGVVVPTSVAHAEEDSLTVLSRNIYLGADVGVALELLPDMPAAAQFMWEQVADTDFSRRAPSLAGELARDKPDVVAIQEATTWLCRSSVIGSSTVVFDFTAELLEETKAAGVEYVIASANGEQAFNPGYSIPVLPFLTTVKDPETFQPLFGSDEAACGFTIGDALLVRADIADDVVAVGSGDYATKYSVVPVVFEVQRGYAWADLRLPSGQVRVLTTHLESTWNEGVEPYSSRQARELLEVTADWNMPLVVIGDFNADPRDPRPLTAANPGLQPDVSTGCAAQVQDPTDATADASCNAYWSMVQAGFVDAGPDSLDPANATWGSSALLAGPDPARLAESAGNAYGYTDRLDYVFTKNGVRVVSSTLVGAAWPDSPDAWDCNAPAQVANAREVAPVMGVDLDRVVCSPTDHVGLLVSLDVPATEAQSVSGSPVLGVVVAWGIGLLVMSGLVSWWAIRRSRLDAAG